MTTRRVALIAAGLAAALVAMAACESGTETDDGGGAATGTFNANPTGALNAWGFNNADDVGQARLDYATKQLSGVTIKMDQTNFDAQKFTTRVASGDVPDVVQMDREAVATYAAQDLILPLDECFTVNNVKPDERWYPNVVDDVRYKGKVWAVPQFYQPPAILLNKTVMDGAGVQDSDIDTSKPDTLIPAISKMYKVKGNVPSTLGFDPQATGQMYLWILGFGGRLIGDNGEPTLDDPANVAGLEMLKRITDAQGGLPSTRASPTRSTRSGRTTSSSRTRSARRSMRSGTRTSSRRTRTRSSWPRCRSRTRTATRSRSPAVRRSWCRSRPRTPVPAASGRSR